VGEVKSHLLISLDPCGFGSEVRGLCGAIVKNPAAEMFSEVGLRGMPECQPLRDCKKCFEAAAHFQGGEFYVYVLREAQEALEEAG
jgi:hypothetical protein